MSGYTYGLRSITLRNLINVAAASRWEGTAGSRVLAATGRSCAEAGSCRRLLHRAACQASGSCLAVLAPDVGASLSSRLLQELGRGIAVLEVRSPSAALEDLVPFLAASGISTLHVEADSLLASAEADRLLPACVGVREVHCDGLFFPDLLPPRLERLCITSLQTQDPDECNGLVQRLQRLLLRLQDAPHLRALHIVAALEIDLPASLAKYLPPSLQTVRIELGPEETVAECWEPERAFDLGAFTRDAGCRAAVSLEVCLWVLGPALDDFLSVELLPALHGLSPLASLEMSIGTDLLPTFLAGTRRLGCSHCELTVYPEDDDDSNRRLASPVASLPGLYSRALVQGMKEELPSECGMPSVVTWAALSAQLGVSRLGDSWHPFIGAVTGCTGRPLCGQQPWALVVWGLPCVTGLPRRQFTEEAPHKFVWRNAAGAGLIV